MFSNFSSYKFFILAQKCALETKSRISQSIHPQFSIIQVSSSTKAYTACSYFLSSETKDFLTFVCLPLFIVMQPINKNWLMNISTKSYLARKHEKKLDLIFLHPFSLNLRSRWSINMLISFLTFLNTTKKWRKELA